MKRGLQSRPDGSTRAHGLSAGIAGAWPDGEKSPGANSAAAFGSDRFDMLSVCVCVSWKPAKRETLQNILVLLGILSVSCRASVSVWCILVEI